MLETANARSKARARKSYSIRGAARLGLGKGKQLNIVNISVPGQPTVSRLPHEVVSGNWVFFPRASATRAEGALLAFHPPLLHLPNEVVGGRSMR